MSTTSTETSTENSSIIVLTDDRNFGQWLDKINEVIRKLNDNVTSTADAQSKINAAIATGQMGVAVSTTIDSCTNSGLYHISASRVEPAKNLYVASNGNCITQIAVTEETKTEETEETKPKIYIRSKPSNSSFSNWIELAEKYYTEDTFLKLIGGVITGELTVKGGITLGETNSNGTVISKGIMLVNNGDATFKGNINLTNSTSTLKITNDTNDVIFDGNNNNSPHIAYYVNKTNGEVSTDKDGKNVEYYLHTDLDGKSFLSHYNVEYYIHKHLNTLNEVDTNKRYFYIQNDGRVTMTLNDTVTFFYKEGNTILNTKQDDLVYFIINDKVYDYNKESQLYVTDNVVYSDEENTNQLYLIEDSSEIKDSSEVVYYAKVADVDREENTVLFLDKTKYYIHSEEDGKEYLSLYEEAGISKNYYLTETGVYSDEERTNLIYFVRDNVIEQRIVAYYIHTKIDNEGNSYVAWCIDKDGNIPSLYEFDDRVILLMDEPIYRLVRYFDTISPDKDGLNTRFYIQKNNTVTSDEEGIQVLYYLTDEFMSSIHTPNVPAFYVWKENDSDETEKKKLITKTTRYYIQPEISNGKNPISSDEEGNYVDFLYSKTVENYDLILYNNKPICINLLSNVCDINGNAKTADELNQRGLTHSFENGETNLAASGKALMDFKNQVQGTYIPYTGGTFTGYVIHSNDIILGKTAKIKAYETLNFHSQGEISFVVNSTSGKIFIDKNDMDMNDPCIFGGRIRTGITNGGMGDVLYNLGSIEFNKDNTRIRYRRTNATSVEEVDEVNDISLYLTPTKFYPSVDNVVSLGKSDSRFTQIYASTDNIVTADETSKTSIDYIDSSLLNKWKNVEWKSYKIKSAVESKGLPAARTHTGLIAEEVYEAIPNATSYGFFCKDNETLSIRYQEAQAIENAYLREEIKILKEEIKILKEEIISLKEELS